MNAITGTVLGIMFAAGSSVCIAQSTAIPFGRIEQQAQLYARVEAPPTGAAVNYEGGESSESSSSSGFVLPPSWAPKPARTLSPGFFVLNGLHLGVAILDIEMTQHCIADQHCREGNPLMPPSQAGRLGVTFAFVSFGTFASYKAKKNESKLWILSPIVGIATHTLGVATGIAHY